MPKPRRISDEEVAKALRATNGNQREASKLLGMGPNYVASLGLRTRKGAQPFVYAEERQMPPPLDDAPDPITDAPAGTRHYSEVLEHAYNAATFRKSLDPSSTLGEIKIKAEGPIGVFLISDLHLGAPQCDYLALLRHIKLLKDIPNLYVIVQGDVLEYAISQRMLDSVLSQNLSPQEQAQVWKSAIDDLADKVLAAVIGNHELRSERMGAFDVGLYMYDTFIKKKRAYLKNGGTLRLKVGNTNYTWFVMHGDSRFGSIYTKTHKITQLMRMMSGWHDVGSCGHTHEAAIYQEEQPQNDGAGTRTITALQAGSYKVRFDEQYPQRLGFMQSSRVRMPGVILYPNEKRVLPFHTVEAMVEVLRSFNGRAQTKR